MKIFILLLVFTAFGYADEDGVVFYISNEFGMTLEEIGWYRKDEFSHILKVEQDASGEIRTLYASGVEIKRWEKNSRGERVYDHKQITEARIIDNSGRVIEEQIYSEGSLESKTVFHYSNPGLSYAETYDGNDILLYHDEYILSSRGELRGVERTWADGGTQKLSLTTGGGKIYREYHSVPGKEIIHHFDPSGKLYSRELWQDDQMLSRKRIDYAEGMDLPVFSEEIHYDTGKKIRKQFDEEGRLLKEIVEQDGNEVEESLFFWNESGQKTKSLRQSDFGIEQWYYQYDSEGNLIQEDYWKLGSLEKITLYGQGDSYIEELFRDGKLFIRVYYQDNEKIKEEFVKHGSVIRVRENQKRE